MFLIAVALLQLDPAATASPPPNEETEVAAPAPSADDPGTPLPVMAIPLPRAPDPVSPPLPMSYSPAPPPPPRYSSIPKPRNAPGSWVSSYDYPLMAMLLDEKGRSTFRANVDAAGRVSACTIIKSSGFSRLDELTCKLVTRRARFNPAMDADGKPVAGTYTQAVIWLVADDDPLRASDLGWSRPAEAKKLKQRGTVAFEVEISAEGTVTACRITRSSGFALLDSETCKRLRGLETPSIARDMTGTPIARTVRNRISW